MTTIELASTVDPTTQQLLQELLNRRAAATKQVAYWAGRAAAPGCGRRDPGAGTYPKVMWQHWRFKVAELDAQIELLAPGTYLKRKQSIDTVAMVVCGAFVLAVLATTFPALLAASGAVLVGWLVWLVLATLSNR